MKTKGDIVSKRNNHLKVLVMQYAQSILEMANSASPNNINQIVSLLKANIKVLENDVQQSFKNERYDDFNYREIN